jgi:hypothetical protein
MLTVKGIYKEGIVILPENIKFDKEVDVLVTFLEEIEQKRRPKKSLKKQFSFKKSQALLKDFKGSLCEAVIEERRSQL